MSQTRPPEAADGRGDAGYRHASYAEAFSEFGTPLFLPRCRGWILRRQIPDAGRADAISCYPLFVCDRWSAVADDVNLLAGDLVSLTIVTDPFAGVGADDLRRSFDVVLPFKEHVVVDLTKPLGHSRHHRKYADRALRAFTIERCERPLDFLGEWVALFDFLARDRGIRGMRAFSPRSFARQLTVPGVVMFRAFRDGVTAGLHVWYEQGDVGYSHLAVTSPEGRELMASYALYAAAFEWFAPRARWLSLGAAAGTGGRPDDGLSFFKRGWSTDRRPVYICGRVLDAQAYAALTSGAGSEGAPYFPAYRRGEFD